MASVVASFTPLGITAETVRILLATGNPDSITLYVCYSEIASWQETRTIKATESFMLKRLGWGVERFRKAKNILTEKSLVEGYKVKNDQNTIIGHYIKINHIVSVKSHTSVLPMDGENRPQVLGNSDPEVLSNLKIPQDSQSSPAILRKKKVAKKDDFVTPVTREEIIELWSSSKDFWVRIIAFYLSRKPNAVIVNWGTATQFFEDCKRHAMKLRHYPPEMINDMMDRLDVEYPHWTLNAVFTNLNK